VCAVKISFNYNEEILENIINWEKKELKSLNIRVLSKEK
jgi:hypothetical protein